MFRHSIHIFFSLGFLASVARFSSLEIVVATLTAFPSTGWELTGLSLLLSLELVTHVLLAPVTHLATLEVVVKTFIAIPASLWEFVSWLLSFVATILGKLWYKRHSIWLKCGNKRIALRVALGLLTKLLSSHLLLIAVLFACH
jgi:hypothetical protein